MISAIYNYLTAFFNSLAQKLTSAVPQIDFGNFTVGLATIFIAMVSLYVAVKSSRSNYRQQIAVFRQAWIESVRDKIAYHSRLTSTLIDAGLRGKKSPILDADEVKAAAEILELETYLRLKLNPEEEKHRNFIDEIVVMRTEIKKLRETDEKRRHFLAFANARARSINLAKDIFKEEWDRLKDELHGRSSLNRKIRRHIRIYWRPKSEWKFQNTPDEQENI